jgi:glycogen(starch) synthase
MKGRIIVHTPEPYSGAAKYVSNLVTALTATTDAVVLFCPSNFAYLEDLARAGATIARSGYRSTKTAGFAARLARNLRFFLGSCIRQVRLTRRRDVVHFQFPLYFPAGLALFVLARIQAGFIVYTAHDPVPHKWLLPRGLRSIEKRCLRWAYTLSDRIIVHSDAAKECLVRVFSQNSSKISVIPHGATPIERPEVSPAGSGILEVLMFGSIREDKGVDLAIEAVGRINSQKLLVRLAIAGLVANAREQAYWEKCKRAIDASGRGISVFERFIPDGEVPRLLAQCHAVLLPYRNFESESGVATVALANGRPILATNRGSFAKLLGSADLGIPIPSPSVEAVEEAIRSALIIGPRELHEKGLSGLEYIRATRAWKSVARSTATLYTEMRSTPTSQVGVVGVTHG